MKKLLYYLTHVLIFWIVYCGVNYWIDGEITGKTLIVAISMTWGLLWGVLLETTRKK